MWLVCKIHAPEVGSVLRAMVNGVTCRTDSKVFITKNFFFFQTRTFNPSGITFSLSYQNFIKIGQVVLAESVTPFWKTGFWENMVKVFIDRKVSKKFSLHTNTYKNIHVRFSESHLNFIRLRLFTLPTALSQTNIRCLAFNPFSEWRDLNSSSAPGRNYASRTIKISATLSIFRILT